MDGSAPSVSGRSRICPRQWAWNLELRPPAKLVLLALVERASGGTEARVTIETIERDTGLAPKTIRFAFRELLDAGAIARERTGGPHASVTTLMVPT